MKILCLLLFASAGFAVLPPLAQSIREIQALLADSHLYEALGSGEPIREITRNERGYFVTTQHYTLQVDIEYRRGEPHKVGPAQFSFHFQEPTEL